MRTFDIDAISDEGLRREYDFLQRRTESLAASISRAYGSGRGPIEFRYINDGKFNAYAGVEESAYIIEVNASIPLFMMVLFSRILSERSVIAFLPTAGTKASRFTLPAIIDPADFDRRANWRVNLNGIRAFAAGTLADMCSTLVAFHELGHIIGGHVDAISRIEGEARIAELLSRVSLKAEAAERRQAWEYEADGIAAFFLSHFVEELVSESGKNDRVAEVFARKDGRNAENALAILIAAAFAFFSYVQGVRREMRMDSSHPSPMVRAYHLKNVLFAIFQNKPGFDSDLFHQLLDERMDEMIGVLIKIKLFDDDIFTEEYMDAIDAELERLALLQKRYRPLCEPFAWISWDAIS
ncbi:hypothetical protein HB662_27980 [Roseomonas frigidaquae]|uniref:Peptidase M48 domain-containing protein n=1 Tax=Falsiroseomonas frigidaquae TaxID=487318 RepID=A0ABX1F8L3_9PROT|nr:hypothetical protein [Falsiroseomonas frigidaquae]NKE48638.1 hypothetical protein [Falsiroseomonas frigidaquae]